MHGYATRHDFKDIHKDNTKRFVGMLHGVLGPGIDCIKSIAIALHRCLHVYHR
jgi:hypothetical protein